MRKFSFFLFLSLTLTVCHRTYSQQNAWVMDSLATYEKSFWSFVAKNDSKKAREVLAIIEAKGSESLDPEFFEFYEKTVSQKTKVNNPLLMAHLYRGLGTLEFFRGNIRGSKDAFKSAKVFYGEANEPKNVSGMAMNIGIMHEKGGDYDSAVLNYMEALPIFMREKDTLSLASVYENIGLAFYRQSLFDSALSNFLKTETYLKSMLDSMETRWVGFYINKYLAFKELNKQEEGMQMLLKAVKIAEASNDQKLMAKSFMRLAEVYDFRREPQKQYATLLQVKSFLQASPHLMELANLQSELAIYHYSEGDLDSAVYYVNRSLPFFEANGFSEELGASYGTLGNVEFKKENYKEAIQYFEKALKFNENQRNQHKAGWFFNIGYAYNKLGVVDKALEHMNKSLEIRKEINDMAGIRDSYQGLAEVSQRKGDFNNAFQYLTLYQVYKDSVFNETKNRQIAELETQYETSKKDQAIAVLEQEKEIQSLLAQKQQTQISLTLFGLVVLLTIAGVFYRQARLRKKYNQALEIKNKEIEKQNAERELLLKEIHHRVKNNLQIISSLLSMQTRTMKDDKMKDAMKESQSRVKTMALIHEKLYQYENLSKINMQEYMQQLSDFLTQTYRSDKQIEVKIDAEEISLDMDMAIPLGLITNELLSNALKYAFEEKDFGEIHIVFSEKEPGQYSLFIKDTGKGLDENLDIDQTKSLGLKLVRTLTRQINGQLTIVSHPGASFEISFSEERIAA
ncbi:histidine kinase dimerization/phosphoacceptor domain -containing protein [Mongoliitalea daihaiensis]|uniref:histidine kinase dimerization/phosphoacceptor domain -containing protein n=1 Tax=Mongoliitalea daihaiensis TaxID=2782006 RepID=UPI001F390622|nr:histidine kinase dimerization/phosphoacceptor domain -containing protein [Mongoliitalea daihaiensis]UJP65364.1 tetratricopeptide repeat protein [Mongoliitalea daihaiensis]